MERCLSHGFPFHASVGVEWDVAVDADDDDDDDDGNRIKAFCEQTVKGGIDRRKKESGRVCGCWLQKRKCAD